MSYCPKCDNKVGEGDLFCSVCGTRLEQVQEAEPEQIVLPEEPNRTLYEVLEVPRTATQRQIEESYHLLSRRYHPDVNQSPDAAIRMSEIDSAYAVLGNSWNRTGYDKKLEKQEQIGEPQAVAEDAAIHSPKDSELVIGKDISWDEIAKHNKSGLLRVAVFVPLSTVEGDKVKAGSLTMPYGLLTVECLEMKTSFMLFITHKVDFLYVWYAHEWHKHPEWVEQEFESRGPRFDSLWGAREIEVLVGDFSRTSFRKTNLAFRLFGPMLPRLYVWVCPKGYLERTVSNNWEGLSVDEYFRFMKPLAEFIAKM